jgi:UDP-N-acetylglucosamine diphosphorylase/glucosamine-1-phosphate N-acetyltransferase
MNIILFDSFKRNHLLPLTYTRPTADMLTGILTLREKWERILQKKSSSLTASYLMKKFPIIISEDNLLIDGSLIPDPILTEEMLKMKMGEVLFSAKGILAFRINGIALNNLINENPERFFSADYLENGLSDINFRKIEYPGVVNSIESLSDIFTLNEQEIINDFKIVTKGRISDEISLTNTIIGNKNDIFIEEGSVIEGATLNSQKGPIYIGKNAEIMEGSLIRGPFALRENSLVKMGSKIYKGTTIGPFCKVAGEIHNVVMFGYSNKAHEGYFGNSVVGEWCNIGAGTNTSNLKNNYGNITLWNYPEQNFKDTGLQFCGLIMGDHTKCGINTMFNSGTVIGVCCNLFGIDYHVKNIPSFSYGGTLSGYSSYRLNKAIETAGLIFQRRNKEFDKIEQEILEYIFENK